ncbi:MAG: iron chelate uptake ABC transporter family permease subunit [Candidatus Bathyarchaeota archaeon]
MNSTGVHGIYYKKRHIWTLTLIGLLIGLVLTVVITMGIGIANIPATTTASILLSKIPLTNDMFHQSWPSNYEAIIMDVRLPRVLLGAMVGAALAVAGTTMQGLFRNPMASPYVLGISSGAAFGASLTIVLNLTVLGKYTLSLMAFIFAILTIFLVYSIASKKGKISTHAVLLTGIAVSLFFSALVSFMIYISGEELRAIIFWIMGGLWASTWGSLAIVLPMIVIGVAMISLFSRELNVMLSGKEQALSLGISVSQVTKIILIFASLITAAAVSVSGCIGFVGLIVPHIMRNLVGPDHRILLPASCLGGAIFLIWTDTIARTITNPVELPVGIITGLLGAPFFIYLLRTKTKIFG